jgi:hypothetical protein
MLEKGIMENVDAKQVFNGGDLYRLYMDRDDIADNLVRRWKGEARGAIPVSAELIQKVEELYNEALVEDDEGNREINVMKALNSTAYNTYLIACSELEKVDIQPLTKSERIAFFLNVYQCMYVHYFLRMISEGKGPGNNDSYFAKLKSYVLDYS